MTGHLHKVWFVASCEVIGQQFDGVQSTATGALRGVVILDHTHQHFKQMQEAWILNMEAWKHGNMGFCSFSRSLQ